MVKNKILLRNKTKFLNRKNVLENQEESVKFEIPHCKIVLHTDFHPFST